jgi:serine protease Do
MTRDFGEIAEKLRRITVQVRTPGNGAGSGVIWSADGLIVTNAHVVRSRRVEVELFDGRVFPAQVEAHDARRDVAALRIGGRGLPAAAAGDSGAVRPGEVVIAVGNPLGVVGALTTGVVHAVGGLWVQAAVRLAPGNSGGPLADAQGRVIGLNTMIASGGLALAVPSNAVLAFLKRGSGPRLGVSVQKVATGFLIVEVLPGSPAEVASLILGDILIAANGKPFREVEDLAAAIETGSLLNLTFLRGGNPNERNAAARLEQRSAEAA